VHFTTKTIVIVVMEIELINNTKPTIRNIPFLRWFSKPQMTQMLAWLFLCWNFFLQILKCGNISLIFYLIAFHICAYAKVLFLIKLNFYHSQLLWIAIFNDDKKGRSGSYPCHLAGDLRVGVRIPTQATCDPGLQKGTKIIPSKQ